MVGEKLKCERCGYEWLQRGRREPKVCASCRSPYWKKPLTPYWESLKKKRKENSKK